MKRLCSQSDETDVDLSCLIDLIVKDERRGCPITRKSLNKRRGAEIAYRISRPVSPLGLPFIFSLSASLVQ